MAGAYELHEIERGLVAGVVADPARTEQCGELTGREFENSRLGTVFDAVRRLAVNGHAEQLDLIEIAAAVPAEVPAQFVAELSDDPPIFWNPAEHAVRVRIAYLEREIGRESDMTREGLERKLELIDELETVTETGRLGKLSAAPHVSLNAASIGGDHLHELLSRPVHPPITPGIWPRGHVTVLAAAPFTGKTTLSLWVAMARAKGVDPFTGRDTGEPPARVLFYSIDETVEQVARRIAGLARFHPGGTDLASYFERFQVIGIDASIDYENLNRLRFTHEGLATLSSFLETAKQAGDPFTDVIVDAYTDMLPDGISDNDNAEATRILGELASVASTHDAGILVLHHTGKLPKNSKDLENVSLRDYARGASAIVAKARVLFVLLPGAAGGTLEVHTMTNLGRAPRPEAFLVSKDRTPNSVEFFRPADPAAMFPAHEYLDPLDATGISISKLAEKLCSLAPGTRPGRQHLAKAHEVAELWERAGLATIEARKRGTFVVGTEKLMPEARVPSSAEPADPDGWWNV